MSCPVLEQAIREAGIDCLHFSAAADIERIAATIINRYREALERIVEDFPPSSADYLSAWHRARATARAALGTE